MSRLSDRIVAAHDDPSLRDVHVEQYRYYPKTWTTPYIERRRKVGWDLYGLLGLDRDNKSGMHAQHGRNFVFFDAPVGLMFTIDRVLELGSWLDYGMFLEAGDGGCAWTWSRHLSAGRLQSLSIASSASTSA